MNGLIIFHEIISRVNRSLRRYVPWKDIDSWTCVACGGCCKEFKINLTSYEYVKLTRLFGYDIFGIDDRGKPTLKKVSNSCVFQDRSGLCTLQPLGLKPIACRMWPFWIRGERISEIGDARFEYAGFDYYVYVDRSYPCPGFGRGKKDEIPLIIEELIEIMRNPSIQQMRSTMCLNRRQKIPVGLLAHGSSGKYSLCPSVKISLDNLRFLKRLNHSLG